MMGRLFALVLFAFALTAVSSEGAIGSRDTFGSHSGASIPVFHNNMHKTGSMTCGLSHAVAGSDETVRADQNFIADDDLPAVNQNKKDMPCHHGTGMKKCHHKGAFSLLSLSMPCHEKCRMQAENRNGTLSKSYDEGKLHRPQQLSTDVELVEFKLSHITPALLTSLAEKVDSPPPRNIS
jgi:hypothetical protein